VTTMRVATIIPNRGRNETSALTRALVDLASRGQRTHCSDPVSSELWLSDLTAERAQAARMSHGCPVIEPCSAAAEARQERFGVWAGVDMTRPNINHRHG
jgi:Transcription factor WhiB